MTDAVIALGQKEQRVSPEAGAPRRPSAVARSASRIQINQVAAVPIQMAGCGVGVAVRPPAVSRPTMGRAHVSNRNSIDPRSDHRTRPHTGALVRDRGLPTHPPGVLCLIYLTSYSHP